MFVYAIVLRVGFLIKISLRLSLIDWIHVPANGGFRIKSFPAKLSWRLACLWREAFRSFNKTFLFLFNFSLCLKEMKNG